MPMAQDTTATPSLLPEKGEAWNPGSVAKGSEYNCSLPLTTNSFLSWIAGPVIQEEQTSDLCD